MNIIVVGSGRVGGELATLLADDGHNVSVVDRKPEAFAELGQSFNGHTVKGVGFDIDVLTEAGAEECDVLAAVTSNDNTNLMTAEVAKRIFNIEHVITRLFAPKREKTYSQLGVDFSCGTSLVAEEIFAKIQAGHGHHIDSFGDYEIVRFALSLGDDEELACSFLEDEFSARVILIDHNDVTSMPERDTVLYDGDDMVVSVPRTSLGELSRYMRS